MQIPYHTTYLWTLKFGTNEPINKTQTDSTDTEDGLVGAKREEWTRSLGLVDANYYIHNR